MSFFDYLDAPRSDGQRVDLAIKAIGNGVDLSSVIAASESGDWDGLRPD